MSLDFKLNPEFEGIMSKPINLMQNLFTKISKINEFYNALAPDADTRESKKAINFLLGGVEHSVLTLDKKNDELCDDYVKLLKWNLNPEDAEELDKFYLVLKKFEKNARLSQETANTYESDAIDEYENDVRQYDSEFATEQAEYVSANFGIKLNPTDPLLGDSRIENSYLNPDALASSESSSESNRGHYKPKGASSKNIVGIDLISIEEGMPHRSSQFYQGEELSKKFDSHPSRDYSFANKSLLDQYISNRSRKSGILDQHHQRPKKMDDSSVSMGPGSQSQSNKNLNRDSFLQDDDTLDGVALVKINSPKFMQQAKQSPTQIGYYNQDIVLDGYVSYGGENYQTESNLSEKINIEDFEDNYEHSREDGDPSLPLKYLENSNQIRVIETEPNYKLYEEEAEEIDESRDGLDQSVARHSQKKIQEIIGNIVLDYDANKISMVPQTDFDYKVDSPPKLTVSEKYESPLKQFLQTSAIHKKNQVRAQSILESFERRPRLRDDSVLNESKSVLTQDIEVFQIPPPSNPQFEAPKSEAKNPQTHIHEGSFQQQNVPHSIVDTVPPKTELITPQKGNCSQNDQNSYRDTNPPVFNSIEDEDHTSTSQEKRFSPIPEEQASKNEHSDSPQQENFAEYHTPSQKTEILIEDKSEVASISEMMPECERVIEKSTKNEEELIPQQVENAESCCYLEESSELVNEYEESNALKIEPKEFYYRSTEYKPTKEVDCVYVKKRKVSGFDRRIYSHAVVTNRIGFVGSNHGVLLYSYFGEEPVSLMSIKSSGHVYDMIFLKSECTLFFYDEVSKSIYRFVAVQVLPDSAIKNPKLNENDQDVLSKSKIHKARKYFINIDDSRSSVGKIMTLDQSETLLCIKTSPRSLKIITNLDSMKYKKFCTLEFEDFAKIVEMKFFRSGILAVLGEKGNMQTTAKKPTSFSQIKPLKVTGQADSVDYLEQRENPHKETNAPRNNSFSEDSNQVEEPRGVMQGQEFVLRFIEVAYNKFTECGVYQFELEHDEKIDCMSVCSRGKFVVAATSSQSNDTLQRLLLLEIDSVSLNTRKIVEKSFASDFSENTKSSTGRSNVYGQKGSANFFSSVHINYYKEGHPVVVAYQQNSPRGVFVGVCTGDAIEEVNFYESYHSYSCHSAIWCEDGYVSFGEKDSMKILSLVNVTN